MLHKKSLSETDIIAKTHTAKELPAVLHTPPGKSEQWLLELSRELEK